MKGEKDQRKEEKEKRRDSEKKIKEDIAESSGQRDRRGEEQRYICGVTAVG